LSGEIDKIRRLSWRAKTACAWRELSRRTQEVRAAGHANKIAAIGQETRRRNSRYEKPDEAVILGAHLDSGTCTGALDNGCNAALVIEAARAIKPPDPAPRTIRFVLFSGEEQGTVGSSST